MKKVLYLLILCFMFLLITFLGVVKPIAKSCDSELQDRVHSYMTQLKFSADPTTVEEIFSDKKFKIKTVPATEWFSCDSGEKELGCNGGNVTYVRIEAEPIYCSMLGSGPAGVIIKYSKDMQSANISTATPKSVVAEFGSPILFGK